MKHENQRMLHVKYNHEYDYTKGKPKCLEKDCGKIFEIKRNLLKHVLDKHLIQIRPFICDICKLVSKNKLSLRRHIQLNHIKMYGKNRPICKWCNVKFTYKVQLKNHLRVLNCIDIVPIKCEYCHKLYKNDNVLKNHIWQYHTGSQAGKKYSCDTCDRSYVRRSDLAKHVRELHENRELEQHKCPYCSNIYKARVILNRHIIFSHKKVDKRHECKICYKSYCRPYHLIRHMKEVHKKQYIKSNECENCRKEFSNKLALKMHLPECIKQEEN